MEEKLLISKQSNLITMCGKSVIRNKLMLIQCEIMICLEVATNCSQCRRSRLLLLDYLPINSLLVVLFQQSVPGVKNICESSSLFPLSYSVAARSVAMILLPTCSIILNPPTGLQQGCCTREQSKLALLVRFECELSKMQLKRVARHLKMQEAFVFFKMEEGLGVKTRG